VDQQQLEQELMFRRCEEDFRFFCETFWHIPVPAKKKVKLNFEARPYQVDFAKDLQANELVLVLKARQIGLTTIAAAYAFWTAFFREDHPWMLVSAGEEAAKRAITRLKYGYTRLPQWMKDRGPEVTTWAGQMLGFDNNSKIEALPSTAAAGRGDSVYGVIFDEAAHMVDANSVFGALDPLTYGIMIVFSTAKGMGNWFHSRWIESQKKGSPWVGVFFPWSAVPERDQAWYEKTKLKYAGEMWLFYQEYPNTPEEAFAKSGQVAIGADLMDQQDWREEEARWRWLPHEQRFELMEDLEDDDVMLRLWAPPEVERDETGRAIRDPNYVIFCDTAEGLEHGDFNAISVWNANTLEEVAAMETRYPIEYMGELLEELGYQFHTALVVIERNNTGLVPVTYLAKVARYPRLYRMQDIGKRKHGKRSERYGWRTDVSTKPKMVHDFRKALGDGHILIHNERFRIQMQTYVRDGKGSYNATSGNHDDAIIATLGAYQGVLDVGQYPTIFYDEESTQPTWRDVIEVELMNQHLLTTRNPLEAPIGQKPAVTGDVKRSITLQG
jgi:hypothetical protein